MIELLRTKNIHYHGIIYAFLLTGLALLQRSYSAEAARLLSKEFTQQVYWLLNTGAAGLFLAFAMYRYVAKTGRNTILSNFHAGVIISFIHPFILAFAINLIYYGNFSTYGISVPYMVTLMIMSVPAAAAVYLIFYYRKQEEKRGADDILDDI